MKPIKFFVVCLFTLLSTTSFAKSLACRVESNTNDDCRETDYVFSNITNPAVFERGRAHTFSCAEGSFGGTHRDLARIEAETNGSFLKFSLGIDYLLLPHDYLINGPETYEVDATYVIPGGGAPDVKYPVTCLLHEP